MSQSEEFRFPEEITLSLWGKKCTHNKLVQGLTIGSFKQPSEIKLTSETTMTKTSFEQHGNTDASILTMWSHPDSSTTKTAQTDVHSFTCSMLTPSLVIQRRVQCPWLPWGVRG